MKHKILIFILFFVAIGNLWSQTDFDLKGKWSLDKIKMNDTLIISEGRFFTFYENTYEFGKVKRAPISQGSYVIDKSKHVILTPDNDISLKGTFTIISNNSESVNLINDTLTLYLTRLYTPSDFEQDSSESKIAEIKGWNSFSNERFDIALKNFNKAYLLDSTNYDAITGLTYSKGAVEGEIDLNLIDIIIKNTEITSWTIGITTAAFVNQYSRKSEKDYKNEDLNPENIAAFYTGNSFLTKYQNGNPKEMGKYQNKQPIGKWINYRKDGTILKTTEHSEIDSIKTYIFHKEDGEIATKIIVTVNGNIKTTIKRYVYYQELPDERGTYLFVSKTGFCDLEQGVKIEFDSSTPDNYIEEVYDLKKGRIWYIWKDGKRTIYRECEIDGTIVWEYASDNPGKYKWENCEKTFIEPIK